MTIAGARGPLDLRDALEGVVAGRGASTLAGSVQRLIERYRAGGVATAPILESEVDVLAYAAYRMPATYASGRAALVQARSAGLESIGSVVDLGGGTGAASWAAADVWPGVHRTLLEQVPSALSVARRLDPEIDCRAWKLGDEVPSADLVTVSYVLSELSAGQQALIVRTAADAAVRAVFVIEPGTPDGYRRVLAARAALLGLGWHIMAPCPHQQACPLGQSDWCHFAARVERSSLHRRLKGGDLGHEDEKFSYLVALNPREVTNSSREGANSSPEGTDSSGRVLRRPLKRKGHLELQVCRPDGTAGRDVVTKRAGAAYKSARDVRWGDSWPHGDDPDQSTTP